MIIHKKKIILILIVVIIILVILLFYAYLFSAYNYAWKICREEVAIRYGCLETKNGECSTFKNEIMESNGIYRSWNETKRCVHQLLPFPYGQKPRLTN